MPILVNMICPWPEFCLSLKRSYRHFYSIFKRNILSFTKKIFFFIFAQEKLLVISESQIRFFMMNNQVLYFFEKKENKSKLYHDMGQLPCIFAK